MRKQLLTLGLAAISSAAVAQPIGVPTSGLLAYYNFNSDLQSHNGWHNLTWGGTQGSYVPGRPNAGEACLLNGTHLIGSMAVPLTIPTGDFTIAGWIKLENAVPNGSYPTLMEWDESLFLRLFSQQGGTVLSQQGGYLSTGGGFAVAEGGFFVSPNTQWMHLAMTQANGTLKLYQNGVVAAEISVSGNAQSNEPVGLIVGGGTNASAINAIKYLNGAIDDLYIYNRGLSQEEVQTIHNSLDCNLGTLALSNGTDICSNPNNPTTLFVPGSSAPYNASLFVESNGGTGIPGGSIDIGGQPFPFSLQVLYGFYPNIQGEFNVKVITPDCQSDFVTVNFLPVGDPSCYDCSVGLLVSDGASFCPYESIQVQSWADASTNPGGILSFELIPLEGQGDGIPLSSYTYPIFGSFTIPGNHSFQGQYSIELKMYYAGEEVPCATEAVTINFLPADDVQCTCEIGTLLVENGTVICPNETVTILEAGSVQLPIGRDLRFEIYDYPNYETYYQDQIPFDAPYTFTHDGTYFGEAVFYVYAGGGNPVSPVDLHTRGDGNDICGSYEVFVTLAQSTDAECLGVGIHSLSAAAISVYPNPTNGIVQINGVQKGDLVEVTDMTGRLIGSQNMVSDNGIIDLSAKPNGLYLLRTAGGVFKVVKE
jgi:hypothetical protein